MTALLTQFQANKATIVNKMEQLTRDAADKKIDPLGEDYSKQMGGLQNDLSAVDRLIKDQTNINGLLNADGPDTVNRGVTDVGGHASGEFNLSTNGTGKPASGKTLQGDGTITPGTLILKDPNTGAELNLVVTNGVKVKGNPLDDDPKGGFRDRQEFLGAVMNYGLFKDGKIDSFKDERIDWFASMNVARRTGQLDALMNVEGPATSTDLSGSVFVPKEFAIGIEKLRYEKAVGFRTRRRTMGAPFVERKYRVDKDHRDSVSGGFKVGRNYELCCLASSAAQYAAYWLQANPIYGAYVASDMLLEMNRQMILEDVEEGMDDEFAHNRVVEILNGTGKGMYLGVWRSNALIVVTATGGANWTELDKDDLYNIKDRFYMTSSSDPVWLAGPQMESQILRINDVGLTEKTLIYSPGAGPEWADGLLLGIPIVFMKETIPRAGFKGAIGLYDFMQYEEGTWRGMQSASSEHARFMCNQQAFKFWMYTDGKPTWERTMIPAFPNIPATEVTEAEKLIWLEANLTYSPFVIIGGADSEVFPSSPHNLTSADTNEPGAQAQVMAAAGVSEAQRKLLSDKKAATKAKAGGPAARGPASPPTPRRTPPTPRGTPPTSEGT